MPRQKKSAGALPRSAPELPASGGEAGHDAPKRALLDGDLIRLRWRSLIGRHPPKSLSHALMDRILAWREQVAEVGDISSRSRAILAAALADKRAEVSKDGGIRDEQESRGRSGHRRQARAEIRVGTVLIREHARVPHRVTVVAEGFEWEVRIYASLSAVACAITGVQWNGLFFFALDSGARQVPRNAVEQSDAQARRAWRGPSLSSRSGVGR